MKKTIDFNKQGGFPFTQATLDFMQESYKSILQTLISYLGVPATGHYIISGVETSGTHLTAGWVVVDGEVLPFKQSTKGAKIVLKESKRGVAFKNATTQDVYIDRWAEASQTQGTALASFTRIKQPGDLIKESEAFAAFLGKTAKAADSDKLDGKDSTAFQPKGNYITEHQSLANYYTKAEALAAFLGKTAKAADSDKLDGKDSTAFQPKGNYITEHQSLLNYYTKAEALAAFLGKTAKATDSEKLDSKYASDFLWKSALSDLPSDPRAGKVASSKALKLVNDKIPSWADDKESFMHVVCAGRVSKNGTRKDYWGKDRVNGFPFSVKKLSDTGEYKIKHNFGSSFYGLVGNGTIGNEARNDRGYNMFVSIKYRNANDCTVIVGNDSAADDAAFSFIIFDLN